MWTFYGEHKVAHSVKYETTDGSDIILQEYHFDSRRFMHRDPEEGPALVWRDENAIIRHVQYRWHGLLHRKDGPAVRTSGPNGELEFEAWWRFGRHHRNAGDGPALSIWRGNRAEAVSYWINGYCYRDPREGPLEFRFNFGQVIDPEYAEHVPPSTPPRLSWLRRTYGAKPPWDRKLNLEPM